MKPAISIVVFTVLSGGGLGLAAILTLFADLLSRAQFIVAVLLAFALTGGGLFASVFHLANPKNAWRAFLRVRTSWLSREAVCALLFFALLIVWAFAHLEYAANHYFLQTAVLSVALLTVFCTAMIYQSLKPIAAWHHPQTSAAYLAFSLQSGALLFVVILSFNDTNDFRALATVNLLTLAAIIIKILTYRRIGKTQDIRIGRAAGFSRAKARLLETGHTGQTFLTREFIFAVSAQTLRRRKISALLLCALMPPLGTFFAYQSWTFAAAIAAVLLFVGLLTERWLFFAEAKHAVRAYHGSGAP